MSKNLKAAIHAFKNEVPFQNEAYRVTVDNKEPTQLVVTLIAEDGKLTLANTWTVLEDGTLKSCPSIALTCEGLPPKTVAYLLNKVYWAFAYFAPKGSDTVRMVFEGQQLELTLNQAIDLSAKFVELEGKTGSPARM